VAAGAYFSSSVLEAGSVENADFTDAQVRCEAQRRGRRAAGEWLGARGDVLLRRTLGFSI
jgi:hypothetical protein